MPSNLTVTAKVGPALTATSNVTGDAASITIDLNKKVLMIFGQNPQSYREFDIAGVTTFTCTISGTNYTFTLS